MIDSEFLKAVFDETKRARSLFPGSGAVNCALVEEVGEVAKALMYEPWDAVVKECIQVAAMALRLAIEGDPTMEQFREIHVHGNGSRYQWEEHKMPKADQK